MMIIDIDVNDKTKDRFNLSSRSKIFKIQTHYVKLYKFIERKWFNPVGGVIIILEGISDLVQLFNEKLEKIKLEKFLNNQIV